MDVSFHRFHSPLFVALVLFMLFVFVAYSGVTMSIDYMSNMVGILLEAGTAYHSRAPEFTPVYLVGFVLLIFLDV
jgi:hypothetical protein